MSVRYKELADDFFLLISCAGILFVGFVMGYLIANESKVNQSVAMIAESKVDKPIVTRTIAKINEWLWEDDSYECVKYVVGKGDTIWGIAERYYPNEDPRKMEWAIRKANNLTDAKGPILHEGQVIWIPDPELYGVGRKEVR